MLKSDVRSAVCSFADFRVILRKIPFWAFQALSLALLSRARLVGELAPFAPACMAAGFMNGWNPAAMLLGCALGCLPDGQSVLNLLPLISCALVAVQALALKAARRFLRGGRQFPAMDFLTGIIAGISLLLPGLWLAEGILYNITTACLSGAVAALLAPALTSALGIAPGRKLLMPDEQLSLSLLILLSLISLRATPYFGRQLATCSAVLVALAGSGMGAGGGALFGIAAGTALTLGGSDPFIGSSLGLCGLLAGCVRALPRPCAALAFAAGNLLTVSWGLGYTIGAVDWLPLAAAALLYCLLPTPWLKRIQGWMTPVRPHADPERLAVRMRRSAARRLEEIGEVFGELADGYDGETALPGEGQLIEAMRGCLCEGCERYEACWRGDQAQAGRLLCRLAAETVSGKEVTPISELPPDLVRHCRRSSQIDRRLTPFLTELARTRRQEVRHGEARSLLSRQFRQTSRLLNGLSTQMKAPLCLDREYAMLARAALERARLPVQDLLAVVDDRLEITAVLSDGVWNAASARHAAALLTDELGIPLSPVLSKGRVPGEVELRLVQAPALTAEIGASCRACREDFACGDSHLARVLPDGRLIAAISDGMGNGEKAAAESARCVSLLRKFVCAGIDRDAALSAVNSLLMMRGGEDMFATADLCVVDLHSGEACFSKLGACGSFVLQEKGVTRIPGGRLPLGILEQVEPAVKKLEVHPGDMIIMVSDGVADDLREGQAEWLAAQMEGLRHLKPSEAARRLTDLAASRDGGEARDDMTVVAMRILARPIRSRQPMSAA